MELEIVHGTSKKPLTTITNLLPSSTILEVKNKFQKLYPKYNQARQSFKLEPGENDLKDGDTLSALGLSNTGQLYFTDKGPQISWRITFLSEYGGPPLIYLIFYLRPACIYGGVASSAPRPLVVNIAAVCWVAHYVKRLLETFFVHRYARSTMAIHNLFRNSAYYWGFTSLVAYYINHPQTTSILAYGNLQLYLSLVGFVLAELGNLSIHVSLRNLRPPGTQERHIPRACGNPFTRLFNLVSCPNYTYEALSWTFFSIMTQSLPAGGCAFAGFCIMADWARNKHRAYRKEFKDYPRNRSAIVPFIL